MRHLLSLMDYTKDEVEEIFNLIPKFDRGNILKNKSIAMIFEKRSTRTRISFELAIIQLKGHPIFLSPQDIHLGVNESIEDTGRILGGYVDGIIARVNDHASLVTLAEVSGVPVINALSDLFHPCQGLTYAYTLLEVFGRLDNLKVTYVGDGN